MSSFCLCFVFALRYPHQADACACCTPVRMFTPARVCLLSNIVGVTRLPTVNIFHGHRNVKKTVKPSVKRSKFVFSRWGGAVSASARPDECVYYFSCRLCTITAAVPMRHRMAPTMSQGVTCNVLALTVAPHDGTAPPAFHVTCARCRRPRGPLFAFWKSSSSSFLSPRRRVPSIDHSGCPAGWGRRVHFAM